MTAHDYKAIDTRPKPCLYHMAIIGAVRAIGFVLFVACLYVNVCFFFSL